MDSTGGVGYPLATYRYVRLCLIAVVAGLLASVILTAVPEGCWQTSISAFYFTATHAVFIGALCAAGIGMIAYKGVTSSEDILLNFSGFLAFVVAFVPTASPAVNPKDTTTCGLWLPTDADAGAAVGNNVNALLIGMAAGLLVFLVVRSAAGPPPTAEIAGGAADTESDRPRAKLVSFTNAVLKWAQVVVPVVVTALLVAGLIWFVADRESFVADGHSAAALALFGGIIAVVILYACYSAQHFCHCSTRGRFAAAYIAIAIGMTATLIVVGVLHVHLPTWNHWILALETALILEFAGFWILQTLDTWNGPYHPAVPKLAPPLGFQQASDSTSAATRTS